MPDDIASPATSPETAAAPAAAVETVNPAAVAAPTAAVESAKEPTLEDALASFGNGDVSDSMLADLESGDPERIAKALKIEPKKDDVKPSPAAVVDEPAQSISRQQAAIAAKTDGELAAAGEGLGRISIKALSPADRAKTVQALDLIRGGTLPGEAFAQIFGVAALPPAVAAAAEAAKPAEQVAQVAAAPTVADIDAQIVAKQAEYKTAKESYDPGAADILEAIQDLRGQKLALTIEAKIEAREQEKKDREWAQAEAASQQRVADTFSEYLTDPELAAPFNEHCADEILLARAKNDPIMSQPDWSEKIGQRVLAKFFTSKAAKSAESVANPANPIPPVPKTSVRLPGSPVGAGFTAGGMSPQTAMAEIDKLSEQDQEAFIQSLDALTRKR